MAAHGLEQRLNAGQGNEREGKADKFQVALDISVIVLSTLRDIAKLPPIPGVSEAAGLAVTIIGIAQKALGNKSGFKMLAEDSAELVYAIIQSHKNVACAEDVPADLADDVQQLVSILNSIQKLAKKGTRRNFFMAMLRSNADAQKIKDYREKLQQSMRVFGLQSNISLRETVHKLIEQQSELINELKIKEGNAAEAVAGSTRSSIPSNFGNTVGAETGLAVPPNFANAARAEAGLVQSSTPSDFAEAVAPEAGSAPSCSSSESNSAPLVMFVMGSCTIYYPGNATTGTNT